MIERLSLDVAHGCECEIPRSWLWRGRHVKLVDGTTVSMPDTPENQEEFPQLSGQKQGLGFPIARMVALISLATAMVCGVELRPVAGKETSEIAMFRNLINQLDPADIVLADRYFCSYFTIATLLQSGVDMVARLHHRRKSDFQTARWLGKGDYLVQWKRPTMLDWMDPETYALMPELITLRQFEVQVHQPGFRVESFIVVTTLTDTKMYSKKDVSELDLIQKARERGVPLVRLNWWPLYDTIQWDYRDNGKTVEECIVPGGWNNGLYVIDKEAGRSLERVPTEAVAEYRTLCAELRQDSR